MLDETAEVVRAERGVLDLPHPPRLRVRQRRRRRLQRRRATARSSCCPRDPDASRAARCAPRCPGRPAVVVTDSFGRAWRHGQCDVAIGLAGLAPLEDWRGRRDADGRELRATWIAVADEAAAAADLVRPKDGREPAAVLTASSAT